MFFGDYLNCYEIHEKHLYNCELSYFCEHSLFFYNAWFHSVLQTVTLSLRYLRQQLGYHRVCHQQRAAQTRIFISHSSALLG